MGADDDEKVAGHCPTEKTWQIDERYLDLVSVRNRPKHITLKITDS
jgi:hypothetical protein